MSEVPRFLAALQREMCAAGEVYGKGDSISTVYLGGGTPSLLNARQIDGILSQLRSQFRIDTDAEITIETNPGTVTKADLSEFVSLGINRISIGVQSFHASELKFLERIHSAEEADRCIDDARAVGIENISVDLIFSLPGQTPALWRQTLDRALAHRPRHLSTYSLIIEEHTPLYELVRAGKVIPLPDDEDAQLYEMTLEILADHGYSHYEVSNFALPGGECRHNVNYWNHTDYLGFGPSAHSFRRIDREHAERWWNTRSIGEYCNAPGRFSGAAIGLETLGSGELLRESLFLNLRCGRLDLETVRRQYGIDLRSQKKALLDDYAQQGLLSMQGNTIQLTPRGFMMCDAIVAALL
jgi:oxygen-independent coproporphyrinogen-3 oxidase